MIHFLCLTGELGYWFFPVLGLKFIYYQPSNSQSFGPDQPLYWASLIAHLVKNPPAMQETLVRFLGLEDPLEKGQDTTPVFWGFPCGLAGKESACNAGDLGSIPGLEISPGKGKGYPLQYTGLENSMDYIVLWFSGVQIQIGTTPPIFLGLQFLCGRLGLLSLHNCVRKFLIKISFYNYTLYIIITIKY